MGKNEENFPATVAKVVDKYTLVINRGSNHNIGEGMKFLIYGEGGEEIIDPVSKKSLGILEIVKGTGEVVLVQPEMATIKSIEKTAPKREIISQPLSLLGTARMFSHTAREVVIPGDQKPFEKPLVGDKAKPV